ncbi:MAG: hypothetical protein RL318_255 [Fibrobacterota bacterium]|jgi:hypothetical protein
MKIGQCGMWAALGALSLGLGGCFSEKKILAGGGVEYRPALLVPVFPLSREAKGRVSVVAGKATMDVNPVVLDNGGIITQRVDDSVRFLFDGMLGLNEAWALRVSMQSDVYGLLASWHKAGEYVDAEVHFGFHVSQMAVTRVDSVYPNTFDLLSNPRTDTTDGQARGVAPELGTTLVLLPAGLVRPWLSWSVTTLADPGLESDAQAAIPLGGFIHSFSAGLVASAATGPIAWGGAGVAGSNARRIHWGWNAYGGVGWEF